MIGTTDTTKEKAIDEGNDNAVCSVEMNICYADYHCLMCYYFNGNYKYGWCEYQNQDTLPDKTCTYWTSKGTSVSTQYPCQTCYYFDGSYRYGWCNYWKQETLPDKTCSKQTQ